MTYMLKQRRCLDWLKCPSSMLWLRKSMFYIGGQSRTGNGHLRKSERKESATISCYSLLGTMAIASLSFYAVPFPVHYELWS